MHIYCILKFLITLLQRAETLLIAMIQEIDVSWCLYKKDERGSWNMLL